MSELAWIELFQAEPGGGKTLYSVDLLREGAKTGQSIKGQGGARGSVRRDPPKKSIRSNVARSDES